VRVDLYETNGALESSSSSLLLYLASTALTLLVYHIKQHAQL